MMTLVRRSGLALGVAMGLLTGGSIASQAPLATAHSQLLTSVPGAGAVLEASPPEIRLVFSEPLEDHFTGLELFDADGMKIATQTRVDQADRRVLLDESVDHRHRLTVQRRMPRPT